MSAQLPRPGDVIGGKYVVEQLIGQGGMGAVFKAKHAKLGNAVAVKVMLAEAANPEAAARFINEGRNAVNIQNEHVVRVFDVDEERGYAYMVLEFLEGEDLQDTLKRVGHLPPPVAVDYVLQALDGVGHAHAAEIVHRDLKPANLYLARRKDGSTIVKVLDFGISKMREGSPLNQSPSGLTSTKAMLGSPLYMSPEQLRSSKSVDQRADIWAMGVILYELMTGRLPFNGETLGELFAAILENEPTAMSDGTINVAPDLQAIVFRCLQRQPEKRWQSARELATALQQWSSGAAVAGLARSPSGHPPSMPNPGSVPPHANVTAGMPGLGTTPQPGALPPLGAITPQPGSLPHPGAITPQPGALPHLGAITPQPGAPAQWSTSDSFGTSGTGTVPKSGGGAIIAIGIGGALLVIGLGVFGFTQWRASKAASAPIASSVASASASPTSDPSSAASVIAATDTSAATAPTTAPTTTTTTTTANTTAPTTSPAVASKSTAAPSVAAKASATVATAVAQAPAKPPATAAKPPASAAPKSDSLQSDSRR
jgi:serine/threonine-protein kinase